MGRVREEKRREEKRRRKKTQKRKSEKKEDPSARKGRKFATHSVFPMIYGSGGSKSRLAKAAGAEPCGQMRDEKLHAVVARSTFPSQKVQSSPVSDHFWKLRCRKSARRCGAKRMKTTGSEHFWKLRCRKNARRCGAKHISKSRVQKTVVLVALFEVQMSFLHGRRKGFCTLPKVSKPEGFVAFSTTTTTTPHYALIHYATTTTYYICTPTLHSSTLHYNCTTLHSTMLHSTLYGQLGAPWRADNVAVGFFTFFCRVLVRTVQGVSLVS